MKSIENHYKRMPSETSTNCLIQNIFSELFQKVNFFRKNKMEKTLNLGKPFEMKSRNPSRKTYQPIFRLTY